MNARFLDTFRVVAETSSLRAAARHLGLSSTSVSEQIKALERDLDARLVSRHGRNIELTESGHAVLPGVRDMLERADELKQSLSWASHGARSERVRSGPPSSASCPPRSGTWRCTIPTSTCECTRAVRPTSTSVSSAAISTA